MKKVQIFIFIFLFLKSSFSLEYFDPYNTVIKKPDYKKIRELQKKKEEEEIKKDKNRSDESYDDPYDRGSSYSNNSYTNSNESAYSDTKIDSSSKNVFNTSDDNLEFLDENSFEDFEKNFSDSSDTKKSRFANEDNYQYENVSYTDGSEVKNLLYDTNPFKNQPKKKKKYNYAEEFEDFSENVNFDDPDMNDFSFDSKFDGKKGSSDPFEEISSNSEYSDYINSPDSSYNSAYSQDENATYKGDQKKEFKTETIVIEKDDSYNNKELEIFKNIVKGSKKTGKKIGKRARKLDRDENIIPEYTEEDIKIIEDNSPQGRLDDTKRERQMRDYLSDEDKELNFNGYDETRY